MPKKTRHHPKRTSKRPAHDHGHAAGGHHERLRAHASHSHGRKSPKRHAHHATATTSKPHRKTSRVKRAAATERRVTEQTLRDHLALACVRRCSH